MFFKQLYVTNQEIDDPNVEEWWVKCDYLLGFLLK